MLVLNNFFFQSGKHFGNLLLVKDIQGFVRVVKEKEREGVLNPNTWMELDCLL